MPSKPIQVKVETAAVLVKPEPQPTNIPSVTAPVKMRILNEEGHDVFELLSDSDSDAGRDSDLEVTDALIRGASRSSSPVPQALPDINGMYIYFWPISTAQY